MDEQVLQAMARWPNVPAMFGWLRLDRRGQWFLIDRNRPDFDEQQHGLGSTITSPQILDFIGRNYEADSSGRWFWQNGPQRVYVDLDLAPLVFRVLTGEHSTGLMSHCGDRVTEVRRAGCSAAGDLWLDTDLGCGILHDLDLAQVDLLFDEDNGVPTRLNLNGRSLPVQTITEASSRPGWAGFVSRPRA